jgi:hypothetical protein
VDLAVVVGVVLLISYIVLTHRRRVRQGKGEPKAKDDR